MYVHVNTKTQTQTHKHTHTHTYTQTFLIELEETHNYKTTKEILYLLTELKSFFMPMKIPLTNAERLEFPCFRTVISIGSAPHIKCCMSNSI
jgi:hypothetical protein